MKAKGKMFWDDGEKTDSFEDGFYQINTFEFIQVQDHSYFFDSSYSHNHFLKFC